MIDNVIEIRIQNKNLINRLNLEVMIDNEIEMNTE